MNKSHLKLFVLAFGVILFSSNLKAEDGSRLWLPQSVESDVDHQIKVEGFKMNNPTIALAIGELRQNRFLKKATIKRNQKCGYDGYMLTLLRNGESVIEAATPVGALYGVYDIQRRVQQGFGEDQSVSEDRIRIAEEPAYKLRMLNHWDNLDGTVERGYAGNSLWKWDQLSDEPNADNTQRYADYARACASIGINATVLNNVNAAPQILTMEYLKKVARLADIFRPYGLKVFLSVNFASPQEIGGLETSDPLDQKVIDWWKAKAKEIYTLIPDFGGFLVKANSEGKPGPCDFGRTHAEGANMLADALNPYKGVVLWRTFVYNPASDDRAMQAYLEFEPLDGLFRDNVVLQIKNGPVDFQPREPFSPLFGAMPHTQQALEFQITQEYLGAANHLFYEGPLWKECLDSDTGRPLGNNLSCVKDITSYPLHGITAIAGVANIGDDANWCGHVFAQANWYAFGRLAWNPNLSAREIAKEWLSMTFNKDETFVSEMSDLMIDSRETVVNYMMPLGLHHIFAEGHHYGPEPWYTAPGVRIDWTPLYYHKANSQHIGFDRTMATGSGATGQYRGEWASMIEDVDKCPDEYLLWFHQVPWTHKMHSGKTLWNEMCSRYQKGLEKARSYQIIWDAMSEYVDSQRYEEVAEKLKIQTHDAQWWKDACLLYFQSINGLPFPKDLERPVYSLDALKKYRLNMGLHGNPTREQLP